MTSSPSISVIMPVKNGADTVEQAIRSVLDSTLRDLEFIIVDDASKDNTVERIHSFNDPRICLHHNPNPGLCSALNQAVASCKAPYIARMDADDWCYPKRFEHQLAAAEQNKWDVVGGKVRIVDRAGKAVPSLSRYESWVNAHKDDESIRAYRFVESPIANPTSLARRAVYEQPFMDGPFPEDYEFWLQAMSNGFRFGKINEVVLDWIDSPTRTTRTNPRYSPEAFTTCRRRYLLHGPLASHDVVDVWGAGLTGKPWVRFLQSQGKEVRQLVDVSPKKIGQTIHHVPVIEPKELSPPDRTPLIVAVGAANAREEIEAYLLEMGYRIGIDVWFVA